jgi:type IV pilus assembly protein PilM
MTGGAHYTEEIQKALSISFEEAERIKLGNPREGTAVQDVIPQEVEQAMRTVSDTVIGEISRSLDFFTATAADARISRVLLSGGGARIAGFVSAFKNRTGIETEIMNPLAHMISTRGFDPDHLSAIAPSLAVGIGLATRRVQR